MVRVTGVEQQPVLCRKQTVLPLGATHPLQLKHMPACERHPQLSLKILQQRIIYQIILSLIKKRMTMKKNIVNVYCNSATQRKSP